MQRLKQEPTKMKGGAFDSYTQGTGRHSLSILGYNFSDRKDKEETAFFKKYKNVSFMYYQDKYTNTLDLIFFEKINKEVLTANNSYNDHNFILSKKFYDAAFKKMNEEKKCLPEKFKSRLKEIEEEEKKENIKDAIEELKECYLYILKFWDELLSAWISDYIFQLITIKLFCHEFVKSDLEKMIADLIKNKYDFRAARIKFLYDNPYSYSVVHFAVLTNNLALIETLDKKGVDVYLNQEDKHLLNYAGYTKHDAFEKFFQKKPIINQTTLSEGQEIKSTEKGGLERNNLSVKPSEKTLTVWKNAMDSLFEDINNINIQKTEMGLQVIIQPNGVFSDGSQSFNHEEFGNKILKLFNKKLNDYARFEWFKPKNSEDKVFYLNIYPSTDDLSSAKNLLNVVKEKIQKYKQIVKEESKEEINIKQEEGTSKKTKKRKKKKKASKTTTMEVSKAATNDGIIRNALCEISGNHDLFAKDFLTSGRPLSDNRWSYQIDYHSKSSIQIQNSPPIRTDIFFEHLINLCNDFFMIDIEKRVIECYQKGDNKMELVIHLTPFESISDKVFAALREIFTNSFEDYQCYEATHLLDNNTIVEVTQENKEKTLSIFISNRDFESMKYHMQRLQHLKQYMDKEGEKYLGAFFFHVSLIFDMMSNIKQIEGSQHFYHTRTIIRHAYKEIDKHKDYAVFNAILDNFNYLFLENEAQIRTPYTALHVQGKHIVVSETALTALVKTVCEWNTSFSVESQLIGRKSRTLQENMADIELYRNEIIAIQQADFPDNMIRTEEKLFRFILIGEAISPQLLSETNKQHELYWYTKNLFITLGHDKHQTSQQLIAALVGDKQFTVQEENKTVSLHKM